MRVLDDWILTPHRLAIHEPTATAVIADVHLGYREARQHSGDAVPLLDVRSQLTPIQRARRRFSFDRLVVAGDLFERIADVHLAKQFLDALNDLRVTMSGLVPGNHDRGWDAIARLLPVYPDGLDLGGWRVVHDAPAKEDDIAADSLLIFGHWHPAVRCFGGRAPCYLVAPERIVLPAFSADASGVVELNPAWGAWRRLAIRGGRVVDVGAAANNENPRRRLRGFRRATGSAGS